MMRERGNSLLRNLDFWAGIPLTCVAAAFRRLTKPEISGELKYFGVLCLGAIGDLLLSSALIRGIKNKNPDSVIEIIASKSNGQALPLLPEVNYSKIFSVSRPDQIIQYIRKRSYDVLIDTSQWARVGNLISNFSNAGRIIGFETDGQYRSCGYDQKVKHRNDCHEVANFQALGAAIWPDFSGQPLLVIPDSFNCEKNSKTIYCHMWAAPGRGCHLKEWPQDNWAQLITELLTYDFSIKLTGSCEDAPKNDVFLRKYFPQISEVQSVAGTTNLEQLGSLFAQAEAVISVNTGTMHLASLSGVPTIGLHGATNPLRWGPIGKNTISILPRKGEFAYLNLGFEYPENAKNSMINLPPEDVLMALKKLNVI